MRTSHSRVLNQARMVKDVLRHLHDLPDELSDLKLPSNSKEIIRIEKIASRLMTSRDRIRSGKAKDGENTHST